MVTRKLSTRLTLRSLSSGTITGMGVSLTVLYIYFTVSQRLPTFRTIETLLLLVLSLMIVYAGIWLLRSNYHPRWIVRTAAWSVIGFLLMVFLSYWIVLQQLNLGAAVQHAVFVTLNIGTVGATGGLLVGLQETRARQRAEHAREADITANRARGRVAFINRLLRHHVLNGMNIINGYTDRLITETNGNPPNELKRIQSRSEAIVHLISNVDVLSRTFTNEIDSEPTALQPAIESAIDTTELAHKHATITADIPQAYEVTAGPPLVTVFTNLLEFVGEHTQDTDFIAHLSTDAAGKAIVIQLHAPTIDIQPTEQDTLFDPGEHGDRNLGMYLVEAIVTNYGGDIWLDEADHGIVFNILLNRADQPPQ